MLNTHQYTLSLRYLHLLVQEESWWKWELVKSKAVGGEFRRSKGN